MSTGQVQSASDLEIHLQCLAYPRQLGTFALPMSTLLDAGKLQHLRLLLPTLSAGGHRALIFSQWTTVLDIIGLALDHLEVRFVRFDGSTAVDERNRLIDEFNADSEITCFLLTTRAGGLGINLTAADTVIIHDCDFNPAADRQAMDRCHRIGQTRPVSLPPPRGQPQVSLHPTHGDTARLSIPSLLLQVRVIKLSASQTVDERIVQIATQKAQSLGGLMGEAISADNGPSTGGLMGSILRETLFGSLEVTVEAAGAAGEANGLPAVAVIHGEWQGDLEGVSAMETTTTAGEPASGDDEPEGDEDEDSLAAINGKGGC